MRQTILHILCTLLCCLPVVMWAQSGTVESRAEHLYQEGHTLFQQQAYSAALLPLQTFLKEQARLGNPAEETNCRQEAAYMLACCSYELQEADCIGTLEAFLQRHPDTPHRNRVQALIASAHFFNGDYKEALRAFSHSDLTLLANDERDDMTYRLALCYLQTGELREAATWLEVLRTTGSKRYEEDCRYYTSYIRYTQQRYEEALTGFHSLQQSEKYRTLVPYYLAEIYLLQQQPDQAEQLARNYLNQYPSQEHATEMQRILGTALYRQANYSEAIQPFDHYRNETSQPRRDALYMHGLSCYHSGVFTRVPLLLSETTTTEDDALTQNAYLFMGLAYLQLSDIHKARMAFEQAAARDADPSVKEQTAYNHALCIHETSYSAFGESVTVFEKFLNTFPNSPHANQVGSYLVEVYMNTRSYDAALASIERISRPGRTILEAKQRILYHLGTQSFANTRFAEAADYFRRSAELGNYNRQTEADALYWLGESNYRLGKSDEAQRSFHRYLTLAPRRTGETFSMAYYNLGYLAFNQEEYAAAEPHFLNYTRLQQGEHPDVLADAYNRLGDCKLHVRRFDDARRYYILAENTHPSAGDYACYQQALVAGLQKEYAEKASLLDKLTARYPQSPYLVNALYEKGRSLVQSGDSPAAITTFNRLLTDYPESPISRKAAAEIGLLHYRNEEYDLAIRAYKLVVTRYPGSEEARLALRDLKSLYVETNRVDEYAALAQQLPGEMSFEADEQDSLTYLAAEKVYMKGDTLSARNSLSRYLQSYPDGAFKLDAHYRLAVLANSRGNEEEVLQQTAELLKFPNSPYTEEALLMHSQVLFNRKQYKEALADYKALQARAVTAERRQTGCLGVLRCATQLQEDAEVIQSATTLLGESKLTPELRNEALYHRAKAYHRQQAEQPYIADLKLLAEDTRTLYGAEAKYLLAQQLYDTNQLAAAEQEVLAYIDQSTPHAYWLARSFILLADIYTAQGKRLDARQYLLSLQQNYQEQDDIQTMIQERVEKLKVES